MKVFVSGNYYDDITYSISTEKISSDQGGYEIEMGDEEYQMYLNDELRYFNWQNRIGRIIDIEKNNEMKRETRMMRKLASIQTIADLQPIHGADAIEVATILGWKVVVKRGEFEVGDLCVYCEIDSVMPDRPEFAFLKDKKYRIKTVKLRGQISQGIAFPIDIVIRALAEHGKSSVGIHEGDDVTELIGVTKWDPPEVASGNGESMGSFPSQWISKTDEIRIQSIPEIIQELPLHESYYYISEKEDGTSATFLLDPYGEFYVCSRNLRIRNGDNTYWDMVRKYDIERKLRDWQDVETNRLIKNVGSSLAIQAEIIGPGIQKNRLGLKHIELRIFNIFDVESQTYLSLAEMMMLAIHWNIPMVKILATDVSFSGNETVDYFIDLAKGTYENGYPREGIVIRPQKETHSNVLNSRLSFKVINNDFLLKEN